MLQDMNGQTVTITNVNQLYRLPQSQAIAYLNDHAHKYLAFARRVRPISLALSSCAMLYANYFKQLSRYLAALDRREYAEFRHNWKMQQLDRANAIVKHNASIAKRKARQAAKRTIKTVNVYPVTVGV